MDQVLTDEHEHILIGGSCIRHWRQLCLIPWRTWLFSLPSTLLQARIMLTALLSCCLLLLPAWYVVALGDHTQLDMVYWVPSPVSFNSIDHDFLTELYSFDPRTSAMRSAGGKLHPCWSIYWTRDRCKTICRYLTLHCIAV